MRIDFDKLAAQGVELELDGPRKRTIALGPSGAAHGVLDVDDASYRLRAGATHSLSLLALLWEGESTSLELLAAAELTKPRAELTIPRGAAPMTGEVRAKLVVIGSVRVTLAGGAVVVELEGVKLHDATLQLGRGGFGEGDSRLEATRVSVDRIVCAARGVEVTAEDVRLRDGVQHRGGRHWAERISVASLHLRASDLAQSLGSSKVDDGTRAGQVRGSEWDLSWLDGLAGRIDADVTVDATVPLIGRRRATHHVRLDVVDGTIDFKRLEAGLSALEDSVLDFVVEQGALQLVKDIPLVPLDRTTLVSWPLPRREIDLARQSRVRLARLLDYHLEGASADAGSSAIALHSLSLDALLLKLGLAGPCDVELGSTKLHLGGEDRPALKSLELRGALHHEPGGSSQHTKLALAARGLYLALTGLQLGGVRFDLGGASIAAVVDAVLSFRGLTPGELVMKLQRIELERAALGSAAPSPAADSTAGS